MTQQAANNQATPTAADLTFGIEIETIGRTRLQVATAIHSVVGGCLEHVGQPTAFDPWHVIAADGRVWKVVADASLSADRSVQAEVVSPILKAADMDTLQEVVRAVRKAGATVNESCGIHVHLGVQTFNAKTVGNLVRIVHKHERHIEHALAVAPQRLARWCKPIDATFLQRLEAQKPSTLEALNRIWYGHHNTNPQHYDQTRYRGLNLHNIWYRGTVEFRLFEATLHAGKVKAYVQLVLALGAKALRVKKASSQRKPFNPATAKYDFRVLLLDLGLVGDEFKTARKHLLANLDGSAAWKHGRPTTAAMAA
jgi:hypothetical protein